MADNPLDILRAGLTAANKRIDDLNRDRPAQAPPGTVTPTPGPDTSGVWRFRLTAGRPAFVDRPGATDSNRRTLASIDRSLVDGVMLTEPASAGKDRGEIAGLTAKLDAKAQADIDLERARHVLDTTLNDPSATMADGVRWRAEVRRLAAKQTQAENIAKGITHENIATRQSDLNSRIDAHRERIAGAVIADLEHAAPIAVMQSVMTAAAERARDTGSE